MIIKTENGKSIDTATDLTPEERHILQKLMAWSSLVDSLEHFHRIRKKALADGWNNSGPVRESPALSMAIAVIEKQVRSRLAEKTSRD